MWVIEPRREQRVTGRPARICDTRRTHEISIEQIDRTDVAAANIAVGDLARIVLEVPVMQRQLRVDLPQKLLETVSDFAMPWQELRTAMHVRRLVDLVLLKPPAHTARGRIGLHAWEIAFVQLQDRIPEQGSLCRVDLRNISANSVTECHVYLPNLGFQQSHRNQFR